VRRSLKGRPAPSEFKSLVKQHFAFDSLARIPLDPWIRAQFLLLAGNSEPPRAHVRKLRI